MWRVIRNMRTKNQRTFLCSGQLLNPPPSPIPQSLHYQLRRLLQKYSLWTNQFHTDIACFLSHSKFMQYQCVYSTTKPSIGHLWQVKNSFMDILPWWLKYFFLHLRVAYWHSQSKYISILWPQKSGSTVFNFCSYMVLHYAFHITNITHSGITI